MLRRARVKVRGVKDCAIENCKTHTLFLRNMVLKDAELSGSR